MSKRIFLTIGGHVAIDVSELEGQLWEDVMRHHEAVPWIVVESLTGSAAIPFFAKWLEVVTLSGTNTDQEIVRKELLRLVSLVVASRQHPHALWQLMDEQEAGNMLLDSDDELDNQDS